MKRFTEATLLLTFIVILLGAYTRLQDAGLGCPDWPGCYGTLTVPNSEEQINSATEKYPDSAFDKGKAWTEVSHRMVAGTLGLFIFAMTIINLFHSRRHKTKVSFFLIAASIVVVFQALLGMWTVTLKLLPQVVTAHLFGGLLTLCLIFLHLLQVYRQSGTGIFAMGAADSALSIQSPASSQTPSQVPDQTQALIKSPTQAPIKSQTQGQTPATADHATARNKLLLFTYIGLLLVVGQIFLGGWVSTNYAALACADFPLCNGKLLPDTDFAAGFNFFHPIGVNYEGGILDEPARTAIHFAHRIGALLVAAYWFVFYLIVRIKSSPIQEELSLIIAAIICQVILGITNVLGGLPLLIATAHNGMAALLLLSVLLLVFNLHTRTL